MRSIKKRDTLLVAIPPPKMKGRRQLGQFRRGYPLDPTNQKVFFAQNWLNWGEGSPASMSKGISVSWSQFSGINKQVGGNQRKEYT